VSRDAKFDAGPEGREMSLMSHKLPAGLAAPFTLEEFKTLLSALRDGLKRPSADQRFEQASLAAGAETPAAEQHARIDAFAAEMLAERHRFGCVFRTTPEGAASSSYYFVLKTGECFRIKNAAAPETGSEPERRIQPHTEHCAFVTKEGGDALREILFPGGNTGFGAQRPRFDSPGTLLSLEVFAPAEGLYPFEWTPERGTESVKIAVQDGKQVLSLTAEPQPLEPWQTEAFRRNGWTPDISVWLKRFHCGSAVAEVYHSSEHAAHASNPRGDV